MLLFCAICACMHSRSYPSPTRFPLAVEDSTFPRKCFPRAGQGSAPGHGVPPVYCPSEARPRSQFQPEFLTHRKRLPVLDRLTKKGPPAALTRNKDAEQPIASGATLHNITPSIAFSITANTVLPLPPWPSFAHCNPSLAEPRPIRTVLCGSFAETRLHSTHPHTRAPRASGLLDSDRI